MSHAIEMASDVLNREFGAFRIFDRAFDLLLEPSGPACIVRYRLIRTRRVCVPCLCEFRVLDASLDPSLALGLRSFSLFDDLYRIDRLPIRIEERDRTGSQSCQQNPFSFRVPAGSRDRPRSASGYGSQW